MNEQLNLPIEVKILAARIEQTPEAKCIEAWLKHCMSQPDDLKEALMGVTFENVIKDAQKKCLKEIEAAFLG